MASKVIIPLPTGTSTTFQNIPVIQNNLKYTDFARISTANDSSLPLSANTPVNKNKDVLLRVDQLEKTVKFLKDEQTSMLQSLHQEIAYLQSKNRDLLCQLIFNTENGSQYHNSTNDNDDKNILMTDKNAKKQKQQISCGTESNDRNTIMNEVYELKYTIDQQLREIQFLKGQFEQVSVRNRNYNRESRQADHYIHDMEERNKDQEKLIRLLRKENKEHKIEMENLRQALSSLRMNNPMSQKMQITQHVQRQTQLFPALGTSAQTFWYHNRTIPITQYQQLQLNSISAAGSDRAVTGNLPHVQFTLPSAVYNYGQMAVSAPPPRYYHNTSVSTNTNATASGCYYGIGQRPMSWTKSYTAIAENGIPCGNRHLANSSNA